MKDYYLKLFRREMVQVGQHTCQDEPLSQPAVQMMQKGRLRWKRTERHSSITVTAVELKGRHNLGRSALSSPGEQDFGLSGRGGERQAATSSSNPRLRWILPEPRVSPHCPHLSHPR